MENPSTPHRHDIDGLRAIAVLSVVAFHAFPQTIKGGFVGVDVFFVISGFLITSILARGLRLKTFRFGDFYSRRIRRIFPALLVVLVFSLIVGYTNMLVDEFHALALQVVGAAGFISNWLVRDIGYFDPRSGLNPLRHLWSLGIEEQFYLLWPPICWLAYRKGWKLLHIAIGLAFASFILNIALLPSFPEGTFYWPMTRLWELMCGAILALDEGRSCKKFRGSKMAICGLALIAASVVLFSTSQPFPGWRAALPVIGTVLVIAAGGDCFINRRLLSFKALVGIGLISYPLYLWHWPLLTFSPIFAPVTGPSYDEQCILILVSFVLAWLTYVLVEKRVRHSQVLFSMRTVPTLIAAMIVIGLTGKAVMLLKPQTWLYSQGVTLQVNRSLDQLTKQGCALPDSSGVFYCRTDTREGPVSAVIYGDSRASAIFPGLLLTSTSAKRWLLISQPGCAPLLGFKRKPGDWTQSICQQLNAKVLDALKSQPQLKTVVLAMAARVIEATRATEETQNASGDSVLEGLVRTIEAFQALGKEVVFLIDNPTQINPLSCIRRAWGRATPNQIESTCGISRAQFDQQSAGYRSFVEALRGRVHDVRFWDPTPFLCSSTFCPILWKGGFLYADLDHYSEYGAKYVIERLTGEAKF